jgi:environmental stress-induced protein Ves
MATKFTIQGMKSSSSKMPLTVIDATAIKPQAWRNGGGQTRELLAWPAANEWKLRISVADIETDGPFSAFNDVQRWFTVLKGAGVELKFADSRHILRPGDDPLQFEGGQFPYCHLLDGPTRDLNLMARGGSAIMLKVNAQQTWQQPFALRGLYTEVPGRWTSASAERALGPQSLLLTQGGELEAWSFLPDDPALAHRAWWLGYSPDSAV